LHEEVSAPSGRENSDYNRTPPGSRDNRSHSNIGDILASTSSMIASGMLSSFLPPRAARSRVRGWSHRTTPLVLVPAACQRHGKTRRPREITAARDGENYGESRYPVERLRRYNQHRTAALLLVSRSRIETDEPDFAARHQMSSPPPGWLSSHSCSCLERRALGIALSEQLVQGIPAPALRLHDETTAFNRDADLRAGLQLQDIEQRGRDGQHDRTADLAQTGCVHAWRAVRAARGSAQCENSPRPRPCAGTLARRGLIP
jgi:hypothetical protein